MSRDTVDPFFFALFPSFFIGIWLLVTTVAGLVSGWFELMRRFPDRDEGAILRIGFVSGTMGPLVRFNGLLTLSASVSGLRVGMLRLLGPFCRDFLVPWEE
ncbi:MAG TPA: hypothetical protein VKS60_20995, partial [Stellaceae bacterium]|nr:hypothetical protein [Stellaceae bacterium]